MTIQFGIKHASAATTVSSKLIVRQPHGSSQSITSMPLGRLGEANGLRAPIAPVHLHVGTTDKVELA